MGALKNCACALKRLNNSQRARICSAHAKKASRGELIHKIQIHTHTHRQAAAEEAAAEGAAHARHMATFGQSTSPLAAPSLASLVNCKTIKALAAAAQPALPSPPLLLYSQPQPPTVTHTHTLLLPLTPHHPLSPLYLPLNRC